MTLPQLYNSSSPRDGQFYNRNSGLQVRSVNKQADGNCLFHAISDQLDRIKESPKNHTELRTMAVEALRNPSNIGVGYGYLAVIPSSSSSASYFSKCNYRIYSIKRPGRLLNFWTFRVGAYSRWALIRGWALIKVSQFSASSNFNLQQNNK